MQKSGVRCLVLSVLSALVLSAGTAGAVTYTVNFSLNGANEVPPVVSAATGTASMTIDTDANTITYSITHNAANPTAAHIHGPAARDKSANVLHGFPSAASPMNGVLAYTEGNEAAILAGRTYVNIHTMAFGGGEIRGQIPAAPQQTPGASTWGMIVLALALVASGVALVARRRVSALA